MRKHLLIAVLFGALAAAGCISSDTASTLYLEPDGSAEWIIVEHNIRSSEDTAAKRLTEEAGFLAEVEGPRPPLAEALWLAGARDTETLILRRQVPFAVRTVARFDRITDLFARVLDACGIPYESSLVPEGDGMRWRLDVLIDPEPEGLSAESCSDLSALAEATDRLYIVAVNGVIVDAVGFERVGSDEVALIDPDEEAVQANGGWWRLSLAWRPVPNDGARQAGH